jgi:hypothetical protein
VAVLLVAAIAALAVVVLNRDDDSGGSSNSRIHFEREREQQRRQQLGGLGRLLQVRLGRPRIRLRHRGPAHPFEASYDEVNDVFRRMQQVADGQSDAIEPDEARTKLSEVISNRDSLRRDAANLTASSSLAREVRADLVAAFDAALVNDREIETCLNTGTAVGPGELFSDCLSSTSTSSDAASRAKDSFRDSYNRLRSSLDLAPVNPTF